MEAGTLLGNGKYAVVRVLGRGGMGQVLLAHDRSLGRDVAVKRFLIRGELEQFRVHLLNRFHNEARILARLRHPNIVRVIEVFEHEGQPCLAMEYLEGQTLAEIIADGAWARRRAQQTIMTPLDVEQSIAWVVELCDGLAHAHARGLIHRDIKPANLMVDEHGALQILDFGIAKIDASFWSETSAVSGSGGLVASTLQFGSNNYMAPEQIDPDRFGGGRLDVRVDVWAVGLVLYELVTRRRAFPREGNAALIDICTATPEPVAALAPGADPALVAIIDRALQKAPSQRFAGAEEMAEELRALLSVKVAPVEAPRPETVPRPSKPLRGEQLTQTAPASSPFQDIHQGAAEIRREVAAAQSLDEAPRRKRRLTRPVLITRSAAVGLLVLTAAALFGFPWRWWSRADLARNDVHAVPTPMFQANAEQAVPSARPVVPPPPTASPRPSAIADPQTALKDGSETPSPKTPATSIPASPSASAPKATPEAEALFKEALALATGKGVTKDESKAAGLYQRACDAGHAPSCNNLGLVYANGRGLGKDEARAVALYERSCGWGDVRACTNAGSMYETGRGVAKDETKALGFYQRSCDGSRPIGCNSLGSMYLAGRGTAKDAKRAVEFYEMACDLFYGPGCTNLGLMYRTAGGVAKDDKRALELFKQACDEDTKDPGGCAELGWMYGNGRGVRNDDRRAVSLYQRACDAKNASGCYYLGYMYDHGRGVGKDLGRAVGLYQGACDSGSAPSCRELAVMYLDGRGVRKDEPRAFGMFQKLCDTGYAPGCRGLGYMYQHGRGVGKDYARAVSLYQRACEGDDLVGCSNLGNTYREGFGVARDDARAFGLYQRGCEADAGSACSNLAFMYEKGRGTAQDEKRAVGLYQRACDAGDALGCSNLGSMYRDGRGVAKSDTQAVSLFQRACEKEITAACNNLGAMYQSGRGVGKSEAHALELFQRTCAKGDETGCREAARSRESLKKK